MRGDNKRSRVPKGLVFTHLTKGERGQKQEGVEKRKVNTIIFFEWTANFQESLETVMAVSWPTQKEERGLVPSIKLLSCRLCSD